jgi:hypothetical protein
MIDVGPLEDRDRAAWEGLARGSKAFYRDWIPDEAYEATWRRLRHGTDAHQQGQELPLLDALPARPVIPLCLGASFLGDPLN